MPIYGENNIHRARDMYGTGHNPCGEVQLRPHGTANYAVSGYRDSDPFSSTDKFQHFEFGFMDYLKGLFNGLNTSRITVEKFSQYFKKKFECELIFAFNAKKITDASTYQEDYDHFTIWETDFDKGIYQIYFEDGVTLEELAMDFKYINKISSDRYYLTNCNGNKINLYYFWVYKNDIMKNKVDKTKKTEYNKEVRKSQGGFMNNLSKTFGNAVEVNKEAAKQAAMIKIGNTATQTVVDILKKNAIPKKYQKFANSPFFSLIVANSAAVAMKQLVPNKTDKVDAVADAMILSSMIEITNMIDINAIVKQVMESVDLSGLTNGGGEQ